MPILREARPATAAARVFQWCAVHRYSEHGQCRIGAETVSIVLHRCGNAVCKCFPLGKPVLVECTLLCLSCSTCACQSGAGLEMEPFNPLGQTNPARSGAPSILVSRRHSFRPPLPLQLLPQVAFYLSIYLLNCPKYKKCTKCLSKIRENGRKSCSSQQQQQ